MALRRVVGTVGKKDVLKVEKLDDVTVVKMAVTKAKSRVVRSVDHLVVEMVC